MDQPIHLICNIYNFIAIPNTHSISIQLHILKQFPFIQLLLTDLLSSQQVYPQYFKQSFLELQEVIQRQIECFGPKKFNKMLESISIVIIQYVLSKLQSNKIEVCILTVSLFQRFCVKYFSFQNHIIFQLIYALAHFKKGSIEIAEHYINNSQRIWQQNSKQKKSTIITENVYLLTNIYRGVLYYKKGMFSSSKCIFSSMVNSISLRIKSELKCDKRLSYETKCFFILTTYYLSENYLQSNQKDKFSYNITQCVEFAKKYYQEFQPFVLFYQQNLYYNNAYPIKLSRIQNKIQRLKSLHLNHKKTSLAYNPHASTATHHYNNTGLIDTNNSTDGLSQPFFKRSLNFNKENYETLYQTNGASNLESKGQRWLQIKAQKKVDFRSRKIQSKLCGKVSQDMLKTQMQNIYIVQQKNDYSIKKKTLKGLNEQILKNNNKIKLYKENLLKLQTNQVEVNHIYPNEIYNNKIQLIEQQTIDIKKNIKKDLWNVVGTLKPTKKIEKYIQAFRTATLYHQTNKFFIFLYNSTSFRTQLKLISVIRRFKSKMERKWIQTEYFKGLRHQVQVLQHKVTKEYSINVYQVQSGDGFSQSLPISLQTYNSLSLLPFNYCFQLVDNRIIQFSQFLKNLSTNLYNKIQLFQWRLKKRLQKKFNALSYKKQRISVKFNKKQDNLNFVLFISSMKLNDEEYCHLVQRIDNIKYSNLDYNLKIAIKITNFDSWVSRRWLNDYVNKELMANKNKHLNQIVKIQSLFRVMLAKIQLGKRKKHNCIQVSVVKINKVIYSLIVRGIVKTFSAEDLQTKNEIFVKTTDISNLNFLQKIKQDLLVCPNFNDQLTFVKRHFQLRSLAKKLVNRSKQVKLDADSLFKKSLCFCRKSEEYLYRGKMIKGKMMYSLIVKDFEQFPRPYQLRVFTISSENLYQVDFQQIIYKEEKIFLEKNLNKIQKFIDIQECRKAVIKFNNKQNKLNRQNSKSTILSSQSYITSELQIPELSRSRFKSKIINQKESHLAPRAKKNSINFKMRHKTALKQKDILLIKKWIEDSHDEHSHCQEIESSSEND